MVQLAPAPENKRKVLLFGAALLMVCCTGQSQTADSAEDIVRQMFAISNPSSEAIVGVAGCGESTDYSRLRNLERALVAYGTSALPAIENAIDALQREPAVRVRSGRAVEWVLNAYAQIGKELAFRRIVQMIGDPDLASFRVELDRAAALSIGLTSYVSSLSASALAFHCGRGEEPRDSFSKMIYALERGDRLLLLSTLSPRTRSTLEKTLSSGDVGAFTGRSPNTRSSTSIGYRFAISGQWAQPDETRVLGRAELIAAFQSDVIEIRTMLITKSGRDCGSHLVRFITLGNTKVGTQRYMIDSSDLPDLLRDINSCLAK